MKAGKYNVRSAQKKPGIEPGFFLERPSRATGAVDYDRL